MYEGIGCQSIAPISSTGRPWMPSAMLIGRQSVNLTKVAEISKDFREERKCLTKCRCLKDSCVENSGKQGESHDKREQNG
jgi:hypothetical protein